MVVFLYIIFSVIAGLVISVIMPGFLNDMNVGFYLFVTGCLAVCALIIILRKKADFFKTVSEYIAIVLSLAIVAEGALIFFSSSDNPTGNEQAIIVAGSGLFVESRLTKELEERLDAAISIYAKNPGLPIVLSGGSNENHTLPQCVAMQSYLEKQIKETGLKMPQIITEDTSSGIFENFCLSLEKAGIESAYVIVSRHNVPRTKLIASRISPTSTIIGADYSLSKYIIYYIRELGYSFKTLICDGII